MRCSLLLLLCLAAPQFVTASEPAEIEIRHLLKFVADSGCTFIRNGDEHASSEAAEHLQMKYRRGRRYASTAENFIDRLASESSWSGRPYSVRCGQRVETSSAWLHRELTDYREADNE